MLKSTTSLKLWIIYALLAFPSFYFVYKFGDPNFGTRDFFDYYKLYKDWDIDNVDAPFNMRLLSSFFVFLINKMGIYYNTYISFNQPPYDQHVFFSAIFFNYLCVASTCVVLYQLLNKHFGNNLLAFIGGLIYLFGFGTLFYELMPITDALSILIFAIVLYYYLQKSMWIIAPLLLLIIQREYIFLAFGLISFVDYFKFKTTYYLKVLLICILSFGIYYILRKTLFYTPKYDHQASTSYFLESIVSLKFPLWPYIKQTLMTLNITVLYVLVVAYKKYKKLAIDKHGFLVIILLFLQINIISFAAVFGNNTGRYFFILVPIVIYQLIKECSVFKFANGK